MFKVLLWIFSWVWEQLLWFWSKLVDTSKWWTLLRKCCRTSRYPDQHKREKRIRIWLSLFLLDKHAIDVIHDRIEKIILPPNLGWLPTQIDLRATFTAEQWKNWTLYLHGLLDEPQIECWKHFVLACPYYCKKTMTGTDITIADSLLSCFYSHTEWLHGPRAITPNMHMYGHLSECIRNYGPLLVFWLFSFEHYNGLLGAQPD